MKELIIISGKGGTGKTSITASFAALAQNAVFADCDVDAADLHLVLEPAIKQTTDFSGGKRAEIDPATCTPCGKCLEVCRFGAVKKSWDVDEVVDLAYHIDPISCEGCKVCVEFCPENAIRFDDCINGQWFISDTRFGTMVHAKLGIAEENSGKLVTLVRKEARQIAERENAALLIVDGSPGIGCPVIASITGADMVLVVTEPTLSGKHDLERVAQLTANFKIPTYLCINKADINPKLSDEIEREAGKRGLKVAGRIGYSDAFTKAQIMKRSIVEYDDSAVTDEIKTLWRNVTDALK
ncbi:MAG: ATP-binding protein [Phycisphaerae bacterium]|nr:ATP-binding protein [Phycisphaerae bacterium]